MAFACIEQKVTLHCHPCTVEQVFESLDHQVSCSFSYNPSQFDMALPIDGDFVDQSLQTVLNSVFKGRVETKARGRHLLIESKAPAKAEFNKKKYTIEGIVKNAQTGEVIRHATIYTVGDHYSALSDENGYYRMELTTQEPQLGLSFSKQNYFDTILIVQPIESVFEQNVLLAPRDAPLQKMSPRGIHIPAAENDVEMLPMVRFLVPEKQRNQAINLDFLENIPVQFSLLPSIGTNRLTSGHSKNSLSLNLISGYNAGLEGLELGSTVNILRQNATGIQAAGVGNIVGGRFMGLQAAGVFNNVRGSVKGVQAAGVYNMVLDTLTGIQAAGVCNIVLDSVKGMQMAGVYNVTHGYIKGLQAAGVFNMAQDTVQGLQAAGVFNILDGGVQGGQLAGVFNITEGDMMGLQAASVFNIARGDAKYGQISGVFNMAKHINGGQVGGVLNLAKDVSGVQLSTVANRGEDVKGAQITGLLNKANDATVQVSCFVNIAKRVSGVQVGVMNISDSCANAFGVLSISKKGYHHLDVYADEVHFANLAFRTGTERFHNILKVGYGSYNGLQLLSYGYGLGTAFHTKFPRLNLNLEVSARQLLHVSNKNMPMNLDLSSDLNFAIQTGSVALFFGPSLHLLIRNGQLQNLDPEAGPTYPVQNGYPPIFDSHTGKTSFNLWPGLRVGVRV